MLKINAEEESRISNAESIIETNALKKRKSLEEKLLKIVDANPNIQTKIRDILAEKNVSPKHVMNVHPRNVALEAISLLKTAD